MEESSESSENYRSSSRTTREAHLRDYFIVLARYKWLIVAAVIVTLSSTVLYIRRQVPVYQAQAKVIIEPKNITEVFSSQSVIFGTDWIDLETQVAAIKTTPVLALAARQLGLASAPEGTPEFSDAVNMLRGSVAVELIENTKMVSITAIDLTPEMARDIANAVAHAYIQQDRLSRLQTGRDAVSWLSTQLADLKTKLKTSEEAFQKFKEDEGIITLDERRSAELAEISGINAGYIAARANRMEIDTIINKLESEGGVNPGIPIALLKSPTLQELGTELSRLQTELAEKKKLFKDTFPGVIELKNRIRLTEDRILTELERQRDFLKVQEESLLSQQESRRKEALSLTRKEVEYLTLEREAITNREMYNALLTRVKELSLGGESNLNNIRVVEPAELPGAPMGGNRLTLILGGVLGLFLGIGFAFFLKYLENTVRTPDDVEQHLDLPVMGVVPQIPEAKDSRIPLLVLSDNSRSAPAEAYRGIRTNLMFSDGEVPLKTIVFTSTGPKEGKTLTVSNLGIALAQAGQKVLLIDADLRRPMLHRVFNLDRSKGLSTVLAGEMSLDEAIAKPELESADGIDLSVLTSGAVPTNPSEILGSAQMKELIDRVREQYDVVLLDSAPVLGMTDTAVLASEADAAVIVIKTGEATRKALKLAISQLEQVGVDITGVILNNVDVRHDRYYDYYYYYYYSPYGDDEEDKAKKRKKRSNGSSKELRA